MHNCIISVNTLENTNKYLILNNCQILKSTVIFFVSLQEPSSASPICTSVVCWAALITCWLVAPQVPSEVGEILQGVYIQDS